MLGIYPAILETSKSEFEELLKNIKEIKENKNLHIDLCDGNFSNTKTVTLEDVLDFNFKGYEVELHLMVVEPDQYVEKIKGTSVSRVIIHVDSNIKHDEVCKKYKDIGVSVALAINPYTDIEFFNTVDLQLYDFIQFMTVLPGLQGQAFLPEVMGKIRHFKDVYGSGFLLAADGGINIETINELAMVGVGHFAIGHSIVKQPLPDNSYRDIKEKLTYRSI